MDDPHLVGDGEAGERLSQEPGDALVPRRPSSFMTW